MERKYANFIYMNGLQYHKKTIQYEEWIDSIEIESFQTTRFNAHNVSKKLENMMAKEISKDIRFVLKKQAPYCLENPIYGNWNGMDGRTIIIAKDALVVKRGTFVDSKISDAYKRRIEKYPTAVSSFDRLSLSEIKDYQRIILLFEQMMDGNVDEEHLRKACSVVPNDVYVELLYALRELAGFSTPEKISKPALEKVKKLSEYYC